MDDNNTLKATGGQGVFAKEPEQIDDLVWRDPSRIVTPTPVRPTESLGPFNMLVETLDLYSPKRLLSNVIRELKDLADAGVKPKRLVRLAEDVGTAIDKLERYRDYAYKLELDDYRRRYGRIKDF